MYNFIVNYISTITYVSFVLFTTSYLSGQVNFKASEGGIWKYIYTVFGYVGWCLYRIVNFLSKLISRNILKNIKKINFFRNKDLEYKIYKNISLSFDMFLYGLVIFGVITLSQSYILNLINSVSTNVIGFNSNIIHGTRNASNILENFIYNIGYIHVIKELFINSITYPGFSILGLFNFLYLTIKYFSIITIVNLGVYTTLYGLLSNKMEEINFKIPNKIENSKYKKLEVDNNSYFNIIKDAFKDKWSQISIVFRNIIELKITFFIILAIYTILKITFFNMESLKNKSLLDVIFLVFSIEEIVIILFTMAVTFYTTKSTIKIATVTTENVIGKDKLKKASIKYEKKFKNIKSERKSKQNKSDLINNLDSIYKGFKKSNDKHNEDFDNSNYNENRSTQKNTKNTNYTKKENDVFDIVDSKHKNLMGNLIKNIPKQGVKFIYLEVMDKHYKTKKIRLDINDKSFSLEALIVVNDRKALQEHPYIKFMLKEMNYNIEEYIQTWAETGEFIEGKYTCLLNHKHWHKYKQNPDDIMYPCEITFYVLSELNDKELYKKEGKEKYLIYKKN